MAAVAESAVELMASGDSRRLKTCSNPDCSWMFYDDTVNRSRQFCSTTPCGSLIRVRRFRARA
jgi:predicted RNA-binding Zn ribbon-like protein